jgi:hypothetical protein
LRTSRAVAMIALHVVEPKSSPTRWTGRAAFEEFDPFDPNVLANRGFGRPQSEFFGRGSRKFCLASGDHFTFVGAGRVTLINVQTTKIDAQKQAAVLPRPLKQRSASNFREEFRQRALNDFRAGHRSVVLDVRVDFLGMTGDHTSEAPHILPPFLTHGWHLGFEQSAQLLVLRPQAGQLLGRDIGFGFHRQSSVM